MTLPCSEPLCCPLAGVPVDMDYKPLHGSGVVIDGGNDPGKQIWLGIGAGSAVSQQPGRPQPWVILTPDQRVRAFISSTLEGLAAERTAARRAIARRHLVPVWYQSGARPYAPRRMYRAYLGFC